MTPIPRLPQTPIARRAGLTRTAVRLAAAVALAWLAAGAVRADVVVDFENNPSLPTQPNNFVAAGPMQTYSQVGVFTISGGVALGNPTFLTAFPARGSPPNLYGTADFADPSLLQTITLTLPASETLVGVSGVFFNGQPITESYALTAFSGATQVGVSTPTLPGSTSASDFFNFSFTSTAALPITSVTLTTPNAATNGWDFFVDTIRLTPAAAPGVPEPSALLLTAVGTLSLLGYRWGRPRVR